MRTANRPKYPGAVVKLLGHGDNAHVVIGRVTRVMTAYGVPKAERDAYREDALSGDWEHLIAVTCRWVQVR
jgi:hypothetical protein